MAFVLHHIPLQINLYVLTFARMSDMTLSLLSAFHFLEHVFFKKKKLWKPGYNFFYFVYFKFKFSL